MSRVFISKILYLTTRRCHSVATESSRAAHAATEMMARTEGATTAKETTATAEKEVFWMRDPKTGYWIPENRFGQVDVAELRDRLLPKRSNHE